MELNKVLENLCYYDTRNPIGYAVISTQDEREKEGLGEHAKKGCHCDNCYLERAQLAEYILELLKKK